LLAYGVYAVFLAANISAATVISALATEKGKPFYFLQ
jgi:hypothetical protein